MRPPDVSQRHWVEPLRRGALLLAALIHLLPLPGLAGGALLQGLYDLQQLDPAVELLLRHRALLFGLLALALIASIRVRAWRTPFAVLVMLADLSFIVLAALQSSLSSALVRVAAFDLVAVLLLVFALWPPARRPP